MRMQSLTLLGLALGAGTSLAKTRAVAVSDAPPRAMAPAIGPGWDAFRTRWGGRWTAGFDAANGTPRFLGAPGIAGERFADVTADVARLGGVEPSQLSLAETRSRPHKGTVRQTLRYTRVWRGAPVYGDEVVLVLTAGRIGAIWSRLTPIRGLANPIAGEIVLPLPDGSVVLARPTRGEGTIEWMDRFGEIVHVESTRQDITVTHELREPGDPLVTHPARFVTVDDGSMTDVTDDLGNTSLTGTLDVTLSGPRLQIIEDDAVVEAAVADGDITGGMGGEVSLEAADVLHHYHQVHDWIASRWTDTAFFSIDEWNAQVTAVVDLTDPQYRCNAFYDGFNDQFAFAAPFGPCVSYARVADIIYHEAGHRIHAFIRYAGQTAGNIGEGSSDYVSATMNSDPVVGNGSGGAIREVATDHVYPDDFVGESHEDGLIWASFLWNLRTQWTIARPATGVAETDLLFLESIAQGPTLLDAWRAVLVADDDNGDLTDGTPHDCELLDLLDAHGLGPAAQGLVNFEHTPVGPQGSTTESYPVAFSAPPLFPLCGGGSPESIKLRWTTDPGAGLPIAGGESVAWRDIELAKSKGDVYEGAIERVPANSQIRYFVEVETSSGTFTASHQGSYDRVWSFWVGDRREVWCDDFEGDTSAWSHATGVPWSTDVPTGAVDDWEFGAPGEAAGEPDTAVSGDNIVATALLQPYRSNNAEHLLTPEVNLAERGVMRLVSFQRWLSVEDGFYDRAGVWAQAADDQTWHPLWTNQPTSTRDKDIVDTAWTLREHDLAGLLTDVGTHAGPFKLAFTLETDSEPTTNYGGWALDDVCVIELDRPEEHYRISGLTAEVAEGETSPVTLTWTMPWIRPVTAVAVVIKPGSAPTERADGVQIATLAPAAPGETMTYVDVSVGPGAWHYAVLLNGRGGEDWWEEVVAGVNTVSVGETEVNVDDGCGCAVGATPGGSVWLMAGALGIGWMLRRRRIAAPLVLALTMGLGVLGCGESASGEVALPDAGPDLLTAVAAEETCGPWAAYRAGRTWAHRSGFGITTTTVEAFDEETGAVVESYELVLEDGEIFQSGENEYFCDQAGLAVASRSQVGGFGGDRTDTFDPPMLLVPRSLEVGDTWAAESTRTRTNAMGTTEAEQSFAYAVLYEQLVAPPSGAFHALLIESVDVNTGGVTERLWRAPDVGPVMRLTYFDFDGPGGNPPSPGFGNELLSIEDR